MHAVLFSQMEPPPEWEEEFNRWYDTEHVPERLALDGFLWARRYVVVQGEPKYAALYALRDLEALRTPGYLRLREQPSLQTVRMLGAARGFTRFEAEEAARSVRPEAPPPEQVPYLFAVLFSVPPEREEEFSAWYDQEHIPLLLEDPRWLAVHRYRIRAGTPPQWTHLALHFLAAPEAVDSEARQRARSTPWRQRLAAEPWFKPCYGLYRQLPAPWEPR